MGPDLDYDVLVIGAGVVGLAVAERLARDGRRTLVLERHATFGRETSSRSSEVIHAGMYYPTGSRKARACVAGNPSIYAWCAAHGVEARRVGKLIVATCADEEPKLDEILARARANGIESLRLLSGVEAARREPNVTATAALFSPDTGIVDSHGLMASLAARARAHGCDFAYRHRVVGADREGVPARGYALTAEDDRGEVSTVRARFVVNAAGLDADAVSTLAGIDAAIAGYRLTYVKGRYFRVHRRGLVNGLVYPVPLPRLMGLGVHVTVELDGGVRLGPDVEVLATRAQDYGVPEDAADAFFAAGSRYLRGLRREDLTPDQAGIRPKLTTKGGSVPDFIVAEESARGLPGWVSLIGIESPGLTCCLVLADEVRALLG